MRILLISAALAAGLYAQAAKKPVTLDAALATPPESPGAPVWAPEGKRFAFILGKKVLLYDIDARSENELFDLKKFEDSAKKKPTENQPFDWENRRVSEQRLQWSPDGKSLLISAGGDLFWWDLAGRKSKQLTSTPEAERDPKLSPDGKRISFRRASDLYVLDLESMKVSRLTITGSATLLNGQVDWVYPEELDLGTAHWWSPDSKRIAYLEFDISKQQIYPHADLLNRDVVYEPQRYPKAGTLNADVRLGVIPASGGRTKWVAQADGKDALMARVHWLPDSSALALQKLNRIQNVLEIVLADANDGKTRTVLKEADSKWVNLGDDPVFLKESAQFVWTSERGGYRHLYLMGLDGSAVQLTSGDWEVSSIAAVDEKHRLIYYVSTEPTPLERHLYVVGFDGNGRRRLTPSAGVHSFSFGPGPLFYVDAYSSLTQPLRRVIGMADGSEWAVFREADTKVLEEFEILPTEVIEVKAPDGAVLYGSLIRPANFDSSRKYPAIVNVYGGPHAQSVRNAWGGASWNQALAHRGFVVWQLDNRGTAGRGHAWETKLFRRFGKQELEDQKLGIEHLISMGFVDAARIAMNGWSYGGFMTLYSLLKEPDLLRAGIAGAPVTDWRNYDTIYTERYLGLPSENEDGYRASSPLHFAQNLKGSLMLVHNFEDDNVLFQHTMQMASELQKAGKSFDLQIYPQKSHGVSGVYRKHMVEAMTAFLERVLKN
jgi:dipeptidyl-peptidase-4